FIAAPPVPVLSRPPPIRSGPHWNLRNREWFPAGDLRSVRRAGRDADGSNSPWSSRARGAFPEGLVAAAAVRRRERHVHRRQEHYLGAAAPAARTGRQGGHLHLPLL